MEHKGLTFKAEDFDEGSRKVKVYLSAFGNVDSDNDIIAQGAFSKTIKERFDRIKYLWQHIPYEPIGKWSELYEDATGLIGVATISNSSKGEDAFTYYKEGIITEHSIGFNVVNADPREKNNGIRTIREVKLWEGSAVTWGANERTPVLAMAKSLGLEVPDYLNQRQAKLIKFLRHAKATDEAFETVEMELSYITETYNALLKDAAALNEALQKQEPQTQYPKINLVETFLNA